MWKLCIFTLAQIYRWVGENFSQTIWDKIDEIPTEDMEDQNETKTINITKLFYYELKLTPKPNDIHYVEASTSVVKFLI
jgi:hypothetical protein